MQLPRAAAANRNARVDWPPGRSSGSASSTRHSSARHVHGDEEESGTAAPGATQDILTHYAPQGEGGGGMQQGVRGDCGHAHP